MQSRLSRWRAFAAGRYRPFHAIAVGQAFTISFASDALFVPLLLRLGAHPAWVILVGSAPIAGSALQALFPQILRRTHGNLRRLTLLLTLFELRGFAHALIVLGVAAGAIDPVLGVALVSATVVVAQTAGVLSGTNITLWTAVVLAEDERRLVGPRMGAVSMTLSTLVLLPAGFLLDAGTRAIGLYAYAVLFGVGGLASILTPLAVARLPRPGRVLVSRRTQREIEPPESFSRFVAASVIASFGQGVLPYLSLYAIRVLGTSAGFAVVLSGVASAGALAGSLSAGSFLLYGSASRTLRLTFVARAGAAAMCAAAIPSNPVAPILLLAGAALFNGAGNAGALATNERLYRLAPPEIRVRCQSRLVAATAGAVTAGALVSAATLAIAGPAAAGGYVALFAISGLSRTAAAYRTDVTPSWRAPLPEPVEPIAAAVPARGG